MNENSYISNLLGAFVTNVSSQIEAEILALGGRNLSHEAALVAIYNHPKETIDLLSRVLGLTHSGTVRLINTLENEGLVKRQKSDSDARAVVLVVTDTGLERVKMVLNAREKITSKVLLDFDDKQRQQLLELLNVTMANATNEKIKAQRICRLCDEDTCRKIGCPVEKSISSE